MNDEFINRIKDTITDDLVFGKKMVISDKISIIPVYKTKYTFVFFDEKIRGNINSSSATISTTPLCFIEIRDTGIRVHNLNHDFNINDVMSKVPDFFSTFSSLLSSEIKK